MFLLSGLVCLSPGLARGAAHGDWTSLGRLAAGLSVSVLVAAVLVAVYTWFGGRRFEFGRDLLEVFEEYDLEIEGDPSDEVRERERIAAFGEGTEDAPEVVGEWHGREVRVRRGVGPDDRSIYEVDVSEEIPGDLVIRNCSLPVLSAKYVGYQEISSEHVSFERYYVVRARRPGRAERVLEELGLAELFGETLAERAPDVHLEEGRLRLVRETALDSAEAVAERLERLCAATEAFIRRVEGGTRRGP